MKSKQFIQDLTVHCSFGKHIAHVAVNEYQKRGLPHIHVLLFVDIPDEIFYNGSYIDQIISAEFPPSNSSDIIDVEINQLVETFL